MRTLYLIMGIVLGLGFASRTGLNVTEAINRQNEKDILAHTLTGMSEGWTRGRDYTEARYKQILEQCYYQGRKQ